MKICFSSDLHGNEKLFDQLVDYVNFERPDILLLGGDQCHTEAGEKAVERQQNWLSTFFRQFLEEIHPICHVSWTSGNHDLAGSLSSLSELQSDGLISYSDLDIMDLNRDWSILAFPFGPVSGWSYRDWARLDINQPLPLVQYSKSLITVNGKVEEVSTDDYYRGLPKLKVLLFDYLTQYQGKRILLLTHYPPFGTNLDRTCVGKHIGSRALLDAIQHFRIEIVCSGHVHEAPYLTGSWCSTINSTICMNPGQWDDKLHALTFRTENLSDSLSHTIFGEIGSTSVHRKSARSMRKTLEKRWNSNKKLQRNHISPLTWLRKLNK